MVHVIKVYFQDQNNENQIRRLAVSSEIVGRFYLLARKIIEIFPILADKSFEVTWRDPEDDVIHMSSDEELAQALANAEDGLLKLYVYMPNDLQTKPGNAFKEKSSHNESHPGVVCDACDSYITGYRYKCLQCRNYDLCSACNAANKHADHDMIKLFRPAHIPREWVFLGARKMWKSMFGRCPSSYFLHCQQKKGENVSTPSSESEKSECGKPQWKSVVDNLLKGDYVHAEKLLAGSFLQLIETATGGMGVKIENPPFPTSSFPKMPETGKDIKKTEGENAPLPSESNASTCQKKPISPENKSESTAKKEATKIDDVKTLVAAAANAIKDDTKLINLDSSVADLNKTSEAENKESSPVPSGLFSEVETCNGEKLPFKDASVNAEGWTFLDGQENEEKETFFASLSSGDTGAKVKTQAMYPDISETAKACETPQDQQSKPCASTEETTPKETIPTTQDPTILNALAKMLQMGFTNEGGWLERLLITKDGNINSALDSLYPNMRRH